MDVMAQKIVPFDTPAAAAVGLNLARRNPIAIAAPSRAVFCWRIQHQYI